MPKHNFRDFQGEVGKEKNHGADQVGSYPYLLLLQREYVLAKRIR